jgi:hypothetical protein
MAQFTGATIDATDITLEAGAGGLGLGAPASQNVGYGVPSFFNSGVNYDPLSGIGAGSYSAPPASNDATNLLGAGYGNLNPATTPGGSANTTATATGLGQPTPGATDTGAATAGSLQDYFIRAVVIILGFIFVAVGLVLFKNRGTP